MAAPSRPDILLVVLDTLRADRLSCYGHPQETTPHLDAFAEQSVLFEQAISPAQWTIPAHASLFTGEYPTTHMTHQIYDRHSKSERTLAEYLGTAGYRCVGLCNNPLLGVVENELDRGFAAFYNYGGLLAERPPEALAPLRRTLQAIGRQINRINGPVQELLTHNEFLLGLMLHPWIVPFWQRSINFKGDTAKSVGDLVGLLRHRRDHGTEQPLFAFLNLMQTHLPYDPPAPFVRKFVPYYEREPAARRFIRSYNSETFRWIMPVIEPFSELEDRALNDMYNAEVAYEDHLLQPLFDYLDQPDVRENTLVVVLADHGEGLNHHDFVGHSLVTYEDLIRVPLIVRYPPRFPAGKRVTTPVSTRRVFHTILEAAGVHPPPKLTAAQESVPLDVERLSLTRSLNGSDPEGGVVFAEAYPPKTLLTLMESKHHQATIERFRCRAVRRAAYEHHLKLITVDDQPDELFDVAQDPAELQNIIADHPGTAVELDTLIQENLNQALARRLTHHPAAGRLDLQENQQLRDRLRGLGYIN